MIARNLGLLGELHVEQRLVELDWHPVRLDTGQMAANADIIAVNRHHRVSLQVKTTAGEGHSHANCLGFGYATKYLQDGKNIFNSKESPLIADIIVGLNYLPNNLQYFLMPAAFAEKICRLHCDYWTDIPKKDRKRRSSSFPIYLRIDGSHKTHQQYHDRIKRNLHLYKDAWHILSEPSERLHDLDYWPLVD